MAIGPSELSLSEPGKKTLKELEDIIDQNLSVVFSTQTREYRFHVSRPSLPVLTELQKRYLAAGWKAVYYNEGAILLVW